MYCWSGREEEPYVTITRSGFPQVPPLYLFLHIFQQPELPAQHSYSKAPLPAPRMFMCLDMDMPEQTFNSRFGMVLSWACRLLHHSSYSGVKELPSPTGLPAVLGVQALSSVPTAGA